MNIRVVLAVLCCVANCCAMNNEFTEFAKDPVKFYQANKSRYDWIGEDMSKMLCQLPPFEQAKGKIQKLITGRQKQEEINLAAVKDRVKKFYQDLLKDSGDVGEYLINVVAKAVEKTEFTWSDKIIAGGSCNEFVSRGLDDVPPYLRIISYEWSIVSLKPDANFSKDLGEAEKALYYERLARKKWPEYDDKYEAKYIGRNHSTSQPEMEQVEFTKKPRKICEFQPDFKEIDSNDRWPVVYERKNDVKLHQDIVEAIDTELEQAVFLLFMTETERERVKYKFNDRQDQQRYEEWLSKIQMRFMNPETVNDNVRIKVLDMSEEDAELFLKHEIAHLIEFAWRIKTETKTANSNHELFSLYIETISDYSKTLRLWELYRTLVSNCMADFLVKKPDLMEMQNSMQSLELLHLYDKEHIAECASTADEASSYNAKIKAGLQSSDFTPHIYALYNAIKLHEDQLSIQDVLQKISTEESVKLTPQNFHELVSYLMK